MVFLDRFTSLVVATYQNSLSKRKNYKCAHCKIYGGESCSDFAKRILSAETPLLSARRLISARLATCQSVSNVGAFGFLHAAVTMGQRYGGLAATLFLTTGIVFGGVGCGGDGGGGGDAPGGVSQTLEFQGTVAIGAPVSGAIVTAVCASATWNSPASDSLGTYKLSVTDKGPCQLSTMLRDGTKLRSFYISGGVGNITPLTDLVVQLADEKPENKSAAVAQVLAALPRVGVDISADPIDTKFSPDGTGLDLSIMKYVQLASKTSISAPSDPQRASALSREWAQQCMGVPVCAPIQVAVPVATGQVASAEVAWWQDLYRWADARVQGLTAGTKSVVSSLAIEAKAIYVEGFLSERSEKQNRAFETSLQAGSDFFDGNYTSAGVALLNNVWTRLETGIESADLLEKPWRVVCYAYLREKDKRGGFGSYVEYDADKALCDLEAKMLSMAQIVKNLNGVRESGIQVYTENKSVIKNGIKHIVDNAGGWRTRALNRGRAEYIKHLYSLSKNSIQANVVLDANEKLDVAKGTFELFRDALRGFGLSDSDIVAQLGYTGEVPTDGVTNTSAKVLNIFPEVLVKDVQRTLTLQGQNLSLTAILTIQDAECGVPFNRSAAGFQQLCIARASGNKDVTVKDQAGGTTLFTSTVSVLAAVPTPVVNSVNSTNASFSASLSPRVGQTAYFQVLGSNMPGTLALAVADCASMTVISSGASEARFSCLPSGTSGSKAVTVKDQAGGTTLFTSTVTVLAAAPVISVTSVNSTNSAFNASATPRVGQTAYFQVLGSNMPGTLALAVADCASMTVISRAASEARFSCLPSGTSGSKAVTVKDQSGGTTLYTSSVSVL